jgi:hypothetical protein
MDIRIYDRSRNVTSLPKGASTVAALKGVAPGQDLFAILDGLIVGRPIQDDQHEFRCDQEFYESLSALAVKMPRATFEAAERPAFDGQKAMYRGVHIVVAS